MRRAKKGNHSIQVIFSLLLFILSGCVANDKTTYPNKLNKSIQLQWLICVHLKASPAATFFQFLRAMTQRREKDILRVYYSKQCHGSGQLHLYSPSVLQQGPPFFGFWLPSPAITILGWRHTPLFLLTKVFPG